MRSAMSPALVNLVRLSKGSPIPRPRLGLTWKLGGSVALLGSLAIVSGLTGRSTTGMMMEQLSDVLRVGTAGVAASADVETGVLTMSNLDRGIALSYLSGDI